MSWRLAKSLETLRTQVNASYPSRSKSSDGSVGDTSHSARKSDHNPDERGVVHAIDITHDPKGGFDSYAFAEMLRVKRDPRLKYIISNGRIVSGTGQGQPAWIWRKYDGSNKHDHHVHISVKADWEDDTSAWDIAGVSDHVMSGTVHPPAAPATLRLGSRGEDVRKLQAALKIGDDGIFGMGTEKALKTFQAAHGLTADGICGPYTWQLLLK